MLTIRGPPHGDAEEHRHKHVPNFLFSDFAIAVRVSDDTTQPLVFSQHVANLVRSDLHDVRRASAPDTFSASKDPPRFAARVTLVHLAIAVGI